MATFELESEEFLSDFKKRMTAYCRERMPNYMTPQNVILSKDALHSEHYKKCANSSLQNKR